MEQCVRVTLLEAIAGRERSLTSVIVVRTVGGLRWALGKHARGDHVQVLIMLQRHTSIFQWW